MFCLLHISGGRIWLRVCTIRSLVVGVNVFTTEHDKQKSEDYKGPNKKAQYLNGRQISSPMYVGFRSGNSIVRYGYTKGGESDGGYYGQNWWHRHFPFMQTADFNPGDYDDGFVQIGVYKPYTFY